MKNRSVFVICLVIVFGLTPCARAQDKPARPPDVRTERNLEYVKDGHERNKLDLYLPAKSDGPVPVIVWVHGGAWSMGSKDNCPAVRFVARGYAVASINYRYSQQAKYPAQIEDCKAAVRWLRANAKKYNLDPDHIGAWGESAGGHLVALLGTTGDAKELEGAGGNLDQSSRVQAVVDFFGPTDFTQMGKPEQDTPDTPLAKLLGGRVLENKDKAAKANPITFVTKKAAPFLIMHGDKDPLVPHEQSKLLEEALKKSDVEVNLVIVKDAGHRFDQMSTPENRKLIEEFFDKHLRKKG